MHILNQDGTFGVTLTPVGARRFFVFTLQVGDQVVGNGEPAIEQTSVAALANLRLVDDSRLDPDLHSPTVILDFLMSDDWMHVDEDPSLYDLTNVSWGEAMDAYSTRAYLWGNEAIFLFRENDRMNTANTRFTWDEALMIRVDRLELAAIAVAAMAAYDAMDATR